MGTASPGHGIVLPRAWSQGDEPTLRDWRPVKMRLLREMRRGPAAGTGAGA